MKKTIKNLLLLLSLVIVGIGMTGCVKTYEDERIEIIRRPQVDVEPESPGWDIGGTDTID